jgi:periplasmic mercuric ion binding protein
MTRTLKRVLLLSGAMLAAPAALAVDYELGVDGLACPFCAFGIEKQLHRLEGVTHVRTDVSRGHVRVTTAEASTLTEPQVRQAVQAAGFTLRSFAPAETP